MLIQIRLPTTIEVMINNIGNISSTHGLTERNIYMHVDESVLEECDEFKQQNNVNDNTLHVLQNLNRNCWHTTFFATFHNQDTVFVILFSNLPHFDHDHKSTESQHISTQFTTFSNQKYNVTCQHIQTFHDLYDKQFNKSSQFTKDEKIQIMTDYVNNEFSSNYNNIVLFVIDYDLHKHTRSKSYTVNKLHKTFNIYESKQDVNMNIHFLDMYTATISLYGNYLQAQEVTFADMSETKGLEYPTVDVHDPSIIQAFPTIPKHQLLRRFVKYKYFDANQGVITEQIRQIVLMIKSDKKKVEAWKQIR